jgi:polysaccharide deacetylase 2 family uncharacterized protein YibQ
VVALSLLFLVASGCQRAPEKKRLSASEIHAITREFEQAASDGAPRGAVIKTRRARGERADGTADELYVGLPGGERARTRVVQNLEGVASEHGLTVDPALESGDSLHLTLRSEGTVTHRIAIERLAPRAASAAPGAARLAILLDDLGSDPSAAEAIFALHVPVTLSVLPYHTHSAEIARLARQHGCEVMLHLPMQSVANETPEAQELKPGLTSGEVRRVVEKMLDAVPEADGVNNHQGSQATADRALMNELMQVLKDEGVFYVDSRTTAETVAYETAERAGVRAAFRNVPFLDDVDQPGAVKRQLEVAIRDAKQKGDAIAIGHPRAATLAALRVMLPEAKKQGVQLVLVSELVR